jgi:hypothetical protein
MKKEYLFSRGEEIHTKKSAQVPKVDEPYYLCHHIVSDQFQKKSLSKRDTDERFHLTTVKDKVRKISQMLHEVSRDRKVWPH